jgi:hypothetical protein
VTPELLRLIAAQVCLHAAMTGTRLAAPLLALQQGYSAAPRTADVTAMASGRRSPWRSA